MLHKVRILQTSILETKKLVFVGFNFRDAKRATISCNIRYIAPFKPLGQYMIALCNLFRQREKSPSRATLCLKIKSCNSFSATLCLKIKSCNLLVKEAYWLVLCREISNFKPPYVHAKETKKLSYIILETKKLAYSTGTYLAPEPYASISQIRI
jgi:hypothetical protein